MRFFITAIGTDSGKTLVSAIFCEALSADYWKPVQAGRPADSEEIARLVSNKITLHKERHLLETPASPHMAADIDGIALKLADFVVPDTQRPLVIEGAGGLMVPLNMQDFVIDLIPLFQAEVILVANLYLGSINHTILSLEALKSRGIKPFGIVFNGPDNKASREVILAHAQCSELLHIKPEQVINKEIITSYAQKLREKLNPSTKR